MRVCVCPSKGFGAVAVESKNKVSVIIMKYLAAYAMLVVGGNATPSAEDVTKVLSSVGVEVDEERAQALVTEMEGKDIHELVASGETALKSVVGVAAAPSAAAPAAAG